MSWEGRYQLGQSAPVAVRTVNGQGTPDLPDDVPIAYLYDASGVKKKAVLLPVVDQQAGGGGWFLLPLFLNEVFAEGTYQVAITWRVAGEVYMDTFRLEIVPGGHVAGAVIALQAYELPHGKFLVQQLDSGKVAAGRNPRL